MRIETVKTCLYVWEDLFYDAMTTLLGAVGYTAGV